MVTALDEAFFVVVALDEADLVVITSVESKGVLVFAKMYFPQFTKK